MKNRILLSLLALLLTYTTKAQMQSFDLNEVRLTSGVFKKAQDVDLKYILDRSN